MKIDKHLYMAMVLFFVFGLIQNATAQICTPDALVKDLYKLHGQDSKSRKDRMLDGKSRKYLDKYFDKALADSIWKDLTRQDGYLGVIDFDPFYNTQDPDIKNLSVDAAKIMGAKAIVVVKFTNSGAKNKLNYQLVKRNAEWKINDIEYDKHSSLLGFFKEDENKN